VATVKTGAKVNARNRPVVRVTALGSSKSMSIARGCDSAFMRKMRATRKIPPQPRLVGVEPNPGPKRPGRLVASRKTRKVNQRAMGASSSVAVRRNMMSSGVSARIPRQVGNLFSAVTKIPYREECLGAVSTAVAFTNTTYILNAANSSTFPWLSAIAAKYEYYRFSRLSFKFVSSSADAVGSTNTALGTIIMNVNYDVLDTAFGSQIQMEDYGGGKVVSEEVPSVSFEHRIEPAGVRGGVAGGWRLNLPSAATTSASAPYPTSSSAHDYDVGLMQVASVGAQAASTAGRVYVCYQVDLATPKIETPIGAGLISARYTSSAGIDSTHPMGTSQTQVSGSNLAPTFSGTNMTMPAGFTGRVLIAYSTAGTTLAPSANFSAGTGTTVVGALNNAGCVNAVATLGIAWCVLDCTSSSVVGLPTFTSATNTSAYIEISQISSGLSVVRPENVETSTALQQLLVRLGRLEQVLEKDSEFEEESPPLANDGSSSSSGQLTRSTVDLISALVTRKAASK